jgi:tryptophan synthase alpha chain
MKEANSKRLQKCLNKATMPLLSPYLTAGYPSLELTVPLMHEMVKSGSDIIELGIPFSEPMAEGVTIQKAMEVALNNGITLANVFDMVAKFREQDKDTPIILMGYMNCIEVIGAEVFAQKAQSSGADGAIIVDLPPEEGEEIYSLWKAHQLDPILLCSPTTSKQRMKLIEKHASGYVYYVSLKGVTGSDEINLDAVYTQYQQRKSQCGTLPLFIGFGIKTPSDVANLSKFVDGVVIGAALIEAITEVENPIEKCSQFLKPIKQAINVNELYVGNN